MTYSNVTNKLRQYIALYGFYVISKFRRKYLQLGMMANKEYL